MIKQIPKNIFKELKIEHGEKILIVESTDGDYCLKREKETYSKIHYFGKAYIYKREKTKVPGVLYKEREYCTMYLPIKINFTHLSLKRGDPTGELILEMPMERENNGES